MWVSTFPSPPSYLSSGSARRTCWASWRITRAMVSSSEYKALCRCWGNIDRTHRSIVPPDLLGRRKNVVFVTRWCNTEMWTVELTWDDHPGCLWKLWGNFVLSRAGWNYLEDEQLLGNIQKSASGFGLSGNSFVVLINCSFWYLICKLSHHDMLTWQLSFDGQQLRFR